MDEIRMLGKTLKRWETDIDGVTHVGWSYSGPTMELDINGDDDHGWWATLADDSRFVEQYGSTPLGAAKAMDDLWESDEDT